MVKGEKIFRFLVFASILSFFFIFFTVNTTLIYHHQQIAWEKSTEFIKYYFSFAGGPAEYIALFITQFFYNNVLGSLIVALSSFLIVFFLSEIIKRKFEIYTISYFLILLMPVVLVALMYDYNYHFSITLNLLFVLLTLFLCEHLEKRFALRLPFYTILGCILVYYISGGIYFLIFMLTSLILILNRLNVKVSIRIVMIVMAAILIPYLANKFIFLASLKMSYFRAYPEVAVMLRYSKPILFYVFLGYIPFCVLISALTHRINKSRNEQEKNESENKIKWTKGFSKIYSAFLWIAFAIMTSAILFLSYNFSDKIRNEIDYKAYLGEWDEVIELSKKLKKYDRMVNFQYNRALLHTDKFLDNLFSYEQILGVEALFLDIPFTAEVALPNSDLYYDLGSIDESQRLAFEAQTLMPYSQRVLERLALNSIITGKSEAANTFLNVISENPLERNWVKKKYGLLESPENLYRDDLIFEKINYADKAEGLRLTPRDKMLSLLQHNKTNKYAFEYLIAFDLMEHDLNSFSKDIMHIANFNYAKLPRVIEEAIVLFASQRPENEFLKSFRISSETVERFREFASITRSNKGNIEKAKQAAIEYNDTYWYYVLFLSPLVTSIRLETRPAETNY